MFAETRQRRRQRAPSNPCQHAARTTARIVCQPYILGFDVETFSPRAQASHRLTLNSGFFHLTSNTIHLTTSDRLETDFCVIGHVYGVFIRQVICHPAIPRDWITRIVTWQRKRSAVNMRAIAVARDLRVGICRNVAARFCFIRTTLQLLLIVDITFRLMRATRSWRVVAAGSGRNNGGWRRVHRAGIPTNDQLVIVVDKPE